MAPSLVMRDPYILDFLDAPPPDLTCGVTERLYSDVASPDVNRSTSTMS